MAPLVVQIVATLIARCFVRWRRLSIGLAVIPLAAGSHFSPLKHDLAAMIPPPLTGALWPIYATGVLEAAGAVGLLAPALRRSAAWGLLALLIAMFPANIYAAVAGVTLNGAAPTPLWLRTPLQVFSIALIWHTTLSARWRDYRGRS